VALESGTVAFFVARQLQGQGQAPVVIDAHEVRLKAHRPTQKSDRRDAHELCEGLRRDIYRVIANHPLNPYFSKLAAKRGYKMAVVAVAHRLSRILFSMLRHEQDFDATKLGVERGPFERKTKRLYRLKTRKAASA